MTMTPPPYTSDEQYFSQCYIESVKKFVELITFMNGIAEKYPNGEEMFNKVISLCETSYKAHMATMHTTNLSAWMWGLCKSRCYYTLQLQRTRPP